jgi:rhamnulokinase
LLNQLTQQHCQIPVHVGPFEATAIGNGLIQAMACGELKNLGELRQLVSCSLRGANSAR